MEAHAEQPRRLNLPVHDPRPGVAGKVVLMVEGGGAAVLDELGYGHNRGVVEAVLRQA
jgi:hypothetical protein